MEVKDVKSVGGVASKRIPRFSHEYFLFYLFVPYVRGENTTGDKNSQKRHAPTTTTLQDTNHEKGITVMIYLYI